MAFSLGERTKKILHFLHQSVKTTTKYNELLRIQYVYCIHSFWEGPPPPFSITDVKEISKSFDYMSGIGDLLPLKIGSLMFRYQTLLYSSKTKATLPLSSSQPHSSKKEIPPPKVDVIGPYQL